jgi:hypothetical protein
MSKLAHAHTNPTAERRKVPRYRPATVLSASIGRHDAIVVDLSTAGARLCHFAAVKHDDVVRFTMHLGELTFRSPARVLASSVAALGSGPGGAPTYESRVQFVDVGTDDRAMLAALLVDLQERQAERWVRNAKGEFVAEPALTRIGACFIRMLWNGRAWEETATHDAKQPREGMTVPADTPLSERKLIRGVYERADRVGRQLIQLIAAAACESLTTSLS